MKQLHDESVEAIKRFQEHGVHRGERERGQAASGLGTRDTVLDLLFRAMSDRLKKLLAWCKLHEIVISDAISLVTGSDGSISVRAVHNLPPDTVGRPLQLLAPTRSS